MGSCPPAMLSVLYGRISRQVGELVKIAAAQKKTACLANKFAARITQFRATTRAVCREIGIREFSLLPSAIVLIGISILALHCIYCSRTKGHRDIELKTKRCAGYQVLTWGNLAEKLVKQGEIGGKGRSSNHSGATSVTNQLTNKHGI